MLKKTPHMVIIGAGIGGLTTAALLLQAGMRVTVLEAQTYPGGCAGTFYHKGYRFDAGATLAGGFNPGGPHTQIAELLSLQWPIRMVDPAWVVHLPESDIYQYGHRQAWAAERQRAFPGSETFWLMQEKLAQISWDLSSRYFPWPPASPNDWLAVFSALQPSTLLAAPFVPLKLSQLLPAQGAPGLRTFVDAQLLISAQAPASTANALYASAALDLPRRGVYSILGGIGALSQTLVRWIQERGGEVLYRQPVTQLTVKEGRVTRVRTRHGAEFVADEVIANLTPRALAQLLGGETPARLITEMKKRPESWSAFTLYLGLDQATLQKGASGGGLASHHQIVLDPHQPLGEGNSVFLSLSDPHDSHRAPAGFRAATLSTHTRVQPWWRWLENDPALYAAKKEEYTQKLLSAATRAIPSLRQAVRLSLAGTPIDFQNFTGRPQGWVGGFAQTSLFNVSGPQTGLANLYRVGDSIFPGQSTAGVTLGALRVAATVLAAVQQEQTSGFSASPTLRGKLQTILPHPGPTPD